MNVYPKLQMFGPIARGGITSWAGAIFQACSITVTSGLYKSWLSFRQIEKISGTQVFGLSHLSFCQLAIGWRKLSTCKFLCSMIWSGKNRLENCFQNWKMLLAASRYKKYALGIGVKNSFGLYWNTSCLCFWLLLWILFVFLTSFVNRTVGSGQWVWLRALFNTAMTCGMPANRLWRANLNQLPHWSEGG